MLAGVPIVCRRGRPALWLNLRFVGIVSGALQSSGSWNSGLCDVAHSMKRDCAGFVDDQAARCELKSSRERKVGPGDVEFATSHPLCSGTIREPSKHKPQA
jgi:hypothetical protein